MRAAPALSLVLLSLTLLGCGKRGEQTPAERAERIYVLRCASCHGPRGQGNPKLGLSTPPRDLSDPALYTRLDDAAIARVIKEGKGPMPAFGKFLSEAEIALVIEHLHTLPANR